MREHRLVSERLVLTVLPRLGCQWESLQLVHDDGLVELLHTAPDRDALWRNPLAWGCFLLAPWSNRITGPGFELDGERYELFPSFPDGTAIHGDVRGRPWTVRSAGPGELFATLDTRHFADFNYPFALRFEHRLELTGDTLQISIHASNVDERRAPVGFGLHPFFKRRLTDHDDDVRVTVPAERVYPSRGCIPVAPPAPVDARTDLRGGEPLGDRELDDCYTDLSGAAWSLHYPGSGVTVEMEPDAGFDHAVVFAPREEPGQGGESFVAVEPVTHANDAFNLASRGFRDTGMVVLEPGQRWGGSVTLRVKG